MNICIFQVFDSTGQFLYCFGENGEGNGQFNAPTGKIAQCFDSLNKIDFAFIHNEEIYYVTDIGVAVDSLDNVIVCGELLC